MTRRVVCGVALFMALFVHAQKVLFSPFQLNEADQEWKNLSVQCASKYMQGYTLTKDRSEIVCNNGNDRKAHRGAFWKIVLNQKSRQPVTVSAESLNEGMKGPPSSEYSIYLDIEYMNGKYLFGRVTPFTRTENNKWQRKSVTVFPEYPIRHILAYVLFRNVSGKAVFRNVKYRLSPKDSLIQVDDCVMVPSELQTAPYFMIRDVAVNSGFALIQKEAMGIRLTVKKTQQDNATIFDVDVDNLTGKDRAFTLVYAYPLPQGEMVWHKNLRTSEIVTGGAERKCVHPCGVGCGANSRCPFVAVTVAGKGYAVGGDPRAPVFSRMIFNPQIRQLFHASDVALTPEVPRAHYRFCTFSFPVAHALRGALEKYYDIYPEAFRVRIKDQGNWMAFRSISTVEGWEDFGFRFKEGDDEPAWDDAHNILTFRYTEPATWWMRMEKASYTYQDCLAEVKRLIQESDPAALAWESSAFENQRGEFPGRLMDTPWCKGIVWSMNSAPGIQGELSHYEYANSEKSFAKRYSKTFPQGVDGEYVDSAELYVTSSQDFRRSHFSGMKTPLTFSSVSYRPGIFKGLISYEYVRRQAERVHQRKRYAMANSTPLNWWWLAPYLDVMGQETNWNGNGQWNPMGDEDLMYRRAICGAKPYCFLMNTEFAKFSHECSRKYMMRALAYGMFPSFFSSNASTGHYFSQPKLYNRDRPLFKKFVPLCKLVAEAGWHPVNRLLSSSNKSVITEQFGEKPGQSYATLFNLSDQPQIVTIKWLKRAPKPTELVTGETWEWKDGALTLTIPGETVRLLAF